jgi:transmembrane sensor
MDKDLFKKWLEETLSKEGKADFEKSEDFTTIQKIFEGSKVFKAPSFNVESELTRFSLKHFKQGKLVNMNWTRVLVQTAAVISLLAVTWWFISRENIQTYETLAGEKIEFFLPDSSEVYLNATSKLTVNKSFWESDRRVSLEGEAYFKVKKGSKFEVVSRDGVVSVLGTEFNVKNRIGFYEVICYEGLVQVESKQQKIKLSYSQLMRIIEDTFYEDKHSSMTPGWISNESTFQSVPIKEVFFELERQYGVKLIAENIEMNQLFSGSFTHNDLTLALKAITQPMNINYEIVDHQTIVLSGEMD